MTDVLSTWASLVAVAAQLFFGATFLIVATRALRERRRASLDVALFFGALTLLESGGRAAATVGVPQVALAIGVEALILLLPYLMLRLIADFAAVPRWTVHAAGIALVGLIGALVLVEGAPPPLLAGLATAYVVVPIGWSAVAFAREARRARGVSRRRDGAVVAGSALVSFGVLALGLPVAVTELADPSVVRLAAELVGLGAGVAYFIGFAPPLWLRRLWQEPELRSLLARAPGLADVGDTDRLLREIAEGARSTLGADGVLIGVPAGPGRLRFQGTGPGYEAPSAETFAGRALAAGRAIISFDPVRDVPQQAALYRERGVKALLAAPIRTADEVIGALTARSSHASLFAEDDLRMCQLLADQAAVVLKGHGLLKDLERRAYYDPLTGLPNSRLSHERLNEAYVAASDQCPFALLLMDLDNFAEVNQTFGHAAGDRLLVDIAERLRDVVTAPALLARWSGDQFAVLLTDTTVSAAESVAASLLAALERPFAAEDEEVEVGASVGIAVYPQHAHDVRELVAATDIALGLAKRAANTYAVYPPDTQPRRVGHLAMRADLRRAIADGSLGIHYQPMASMRSGRIVRLEALARWEDPERGIVSPAEFVPLAERTGLIRSLTDRILERALSDVSSWPSLPPLRVSVNLSARAFADAGLVDQVRAATSRTRCDPGMLSIEITESILMTEPEHARRTIARLRDLGISVEIDDFGTGYSSLAYLQRLPVDGLKIDRQFVVAMGREERSEAIVRATIRLAHELGFEVTAEGIEDRRSWDLLAASGCDVAQGYLIARPMPAEAVTEWLLSWRPEAFREQTPSRAAPQARAARRLVLVVDDDPAIVSIVGDVLREHGYAVATAANGEEALALVGQDRPALVLLDVHMPVLDAGGFVAALRDRGVSVPLVVMSAGSNAPRWAQRLEASGHLAKPFGMEQLLSVTERALRTAPIN